MDTTSENVFALLIPLLQPFVKQVVQETVKAMIPQLEEATQPRERKKYSRKECAEHLHITLPTLHALTKKGVLRAERLGGKVLYDAEQVEEALKQNGNLKYRRF